MKFLNLTRATEIGANSYHLEAAGHGVVLDCGMHPKREGEEALPNLGLLAGRPVDGVIISHAHLDHIGSLPVLMRRHPRAPVFMNEATAEIADTLLHNSVNVMMRQREELRLAAYPLFTHGETNHATDSWHHCPMRQPWTLAGERATASDEAPMTFEFFEAGHVLGASGVLIRAEGRTVFYTGDINFENQTIARGAEFPESGIDVLVIETTRGDYATPPEFTRAAEEARFASALAEVFAGGGCVLVPVFALGKTQEVLAMLHQAQRRGALSPVPIYIGGLSTKMTEIYDRRARTSARLLPKLQLMQEIEPQVLNGRNIDEAPARPGRIYALSSGMMTPKTLSNTFARRLLEDPRHAIFFVGYADPESPAGILQRSPLGAEVALDPDEPTQPRRCRIEQFQFSAHGTRESILAYIKRVAPRKVLLVHGDVPAVEWFRAQLATELPASEVIVPPPGEAIEI